MGIFTKQPAAAERKAFDLAEQRLQAVADKLAQVQRDLAAARARLAALAPGTIDLEVDIDAAAAAFGAEHSALSARVAFLGAMREKLTQELAAGRRAVLTAEQAVDTALQQHFQLAADDRLRRLAGIVAEEVEALACELARADGSPHSVQSLDAVMGALKDAIVATGKVSQDFGVGLSFAVSASPKIPPAPRSQLLDGDHRSGRHLDRLNPPIDVQAVRRNLSDVDGYITDNRHALLMLGRNGADGPKARELERLIHEAEQSRAELAQQLADAEARAKLAA